MIMLGSRLMINGRGPVWIEKEMCLLGASVDRWGDRASNCKG